MQSGDKKYDYWTLEFFEGEEATGKWAEPLMGWTANADPLSQLQHRVKFPTKEDAVTYCEKFGYTFEVQENAPEDPKKGKSYADKFKYKAPKEDW